MFISLKELVEISPFSQRTTKYKISDCPKKAIENGVKGRPQKGLYIKDLPEDLKLIAQDYLIKKNNNINLPVVREKSVKANHVSEKNNNVGLAWFRLIKAWRARINEAGHGSKVEVTKDFLVAYNSGGLFPDIYNNVGRVSSKTLYRKNKQLKDNNDDYLMIIDGRVIKNRKRPSVLTDIEKEYFLKCYLNINRPSFIEAYRGVNEILKNRGAEKIPSEVTFRRWFNKDWAPCNDHVVVLAREGEKAYKDKVGPYITRDTKVLKVGDVLVADGHKLNFWIRHPDTGKNVRMILIVFFDWASRFPVGWQIMPTESTTAVLAALRTAILVLGKKPVCCYLDNGKAFRNKYFNKTNPDFEDLRGLYARLGVGTVYAMPYNARAKVVEPFFHTMNEQFERLVPSYCGASIDDKPAHLNRNEKFHKKQYQEKYGDWVPDIREAAHMIDLYFRWYGNQRHDGLNGKTPLEILTPALGQGVDVEELNYQMLWSVKKTPRNCRIKNLWGIDYEADFLHGLNMELIVKYDTSDLSKVFCYQEDGFYLGEANAVQAIHPVARIFGDTIGVEEVKREMKRQNSLKKKTVEAVKEIGGKHEDIEYVKSISGWGGKREIVFDDRDNVGADKTDKEGAIDQNEIKRLELIADNAEKEMLLEEERKKDVYNDCPEFFNSELERYSWCFYALYKDKGELKNEDMAFMRYFEETEQFVKMYKSRFDDLYMLYAA